MVPGFSDRGPPLFSWIAPNRIGQNSRHNAHGLRQSVGHKCKYDQADDSVEREHAPCLSQG
jgi:hypothetical protein